MAKLPKNEKKDELKKLPRQELIDRVLAYPDFNSLNRDDGNRKRPHPIGHMAESVKNNGYEMSDKQYYTILSEFANITTPTLRVTKDSMLNPSAINLGDELSVDGTKSVYAVDGVLKAEQKDGKNVVAIYMNNQDGEQVRAGYMPKVFAAKHYDSVEALGEVAVSGEMTDFSNKHLKNVCYDITMDLEPMLTQAAPILAESKEAIEENVEIYRYGVDWTLEGPVSDEDAAKDFLEAQDMTSRLQDYLADKGAEFADNIVDIEWVHHDGSIGTTYLATNAPLTPDQLDVVADFVSKENTEGIGKEFSEMPFAFEDDCQMATFDKDEVYVFTTASFNAQSAMKEYEEAQENAVETKEAAPEAAETVTEEAAAEADNSLALTDADLDFAKQEELNLQS